MSRVVVIYNPIAGGSRGARVSARVEERMSEAGHEVERIPTRDRSGAVSIAAEVGRRADLVVAVGGDGTLREVVEGLGDARARVAVGVVPMGNANIVANDLGIPDGPDRAIDVLLAGAPVPLDLGAVRTRDGAGLFLGVVGVGWDADAVHLLDRIRHGKLGRHAYRIWADGLYGVTGTAAALRPRQPRFTIEADGTPMSDRRYCAAFFGNLRTYAKGFAVTPDARRDSGRIQCAARRSALVPVLAVQLGAALLGRRAPGWVSDYRTATSFAVRGEVDLRVEVDGDDHGVTDRLEVGVLPAAVRILAPPP